VASVSVKGMLAATTFFRSERISCRISWMLASLTCSSVMFMPLVADGAGCWALINPAATSRDVARETEKIMVLFNFEYSFPTVCQLWFGVGTGNFASLDEVRDWVRSEEVGALCVSEPVHEVERCLFRCIISPGSHPFTGHFGRSHWHLVWELRTVAFSLICKTAAFSLAATSPGGLM
jgi:hypothetical protein